MQPSDTELEDLIALAQSPGWARFCQFVAAEWGYKAYRQKSQRILGGISADKPQEAAMHLLQLETAAREIEKVMGWVGERVNKLQNRETVEQ